MSIMPLSPDELDARSFYPSFDLNAETITRRIHKILAPVSLTSAVITGFIGAYFWTALAASIIQTSSIAMATIAFFQFLPLALFPLVALGCACLFQYSRGVLQDTAPKHGFAVHASQPQPVLV